MQRTYDNKQVENIKKTQMKKKNQILLIVNKWFHKETSSFFFFYELANLKAKRK